MIKTQIISSFIAEVALGWNFLGIPNPHPGDLGWEFLILG